MEIGEALDLCDWPIVADKTKVYDLLLRGLRACDESASMPQTRNLERIIKVTKDLLKRRALRLDPTVSHLE
ncbi:unnamed protein product [Strongylus vulgaris]|uniref:Uncharacterized protein n=1 Tax=Strongylus vulgaris TaxID=40348 RepID=A0A3P7JEK3_STRVU|nr:unnamed protein product [Strongylus vulgaris]